MQCQQCTAEMPDDNLFCEDCGVRLASNAPQCVCGAPLSETDEDGYCLRCGRHSRRPPTDHVEQQLSQACAAVTDRGLKHDRNEDRFEIYQRGEAYALIVCDGVSSSSDSALASSAVAGVAREHLSILLNNGRILNAETKIRDAIAAAQAKLAADPENRNSDNPPSTTVVAAVVADGHVTVGWVGDSRAYWIGADRVCQLTRDHSWMNDVVSAGAMNQEDAAQAPQAHAITRWLGADAGDGARADTMRYRIPGPGLLLLCTDGLWNYAPTNETMAKTVREANPEGSDALAIARNLVEFSNASGGHDNITAIVLLHSVGSAK